MMNLQRLLKQWSSALKTRRFADGEFLIDFSPDVHHLELAEGILLHDDALMPLWSEFRDAIAAMTATTHQYFLLIIQDVQLVRSVLNLLLPVLNRAPLAGLLLRNNRLPRHGTLALAKFLELNTNITCLAACNKIESKDDCVSLAQAIRHHPRIESLILHQIGLGGNGSLMKSMMPALHNRTLEAVSLGDNKIDSVGAELIADFLRANPNLKTLHLDKNLLTDDDVVLLAESLTTNTNLVELNLHDNPFGRCGVNALLFCVYNNISPNAIHDSNHTVTMKFRPSQCGDLVREEEFDIVFNASNGSPKNRRQAKIALALSSGGTGIVSFRLLDDIPFRLMPHMLGLLAIEISDDVWRNADCSRLDLVVHVLAWNMPWLYTQGWRQQRREHGSKRGRNASSSVPLRRSARLRLKVMHRVT
jgi:hypothetical protein